jgi:hypothetical protein
MQTILREILPTAKHRIQNTRRIKVILRQYHK